MGSKLAYTTIASKILNQILPKVWDFKQDLKIFLMNEDVSADIYGLLLYTLYQVFTIFVIIMKFLEQNFHALHIKALNLTLIITKTMNHKIFKISYTI